MAQDYSMDDLSHDLLYLFSNRNFTTSPNTRMISNECTDKEQAKLLKGIGIDESVPFGEDLHLHTHFGDRFLQFQVVIIVTFVILEGFVYIGFDLFMSARFCRLPVIARIDEVYDDHCSKHGYYHDNDFGYPAVIHVNIL